MIEYEGQSPRLAGDIRVQRDGRLLLRNGPRELNALSQWFHLDVIVGEIDVSART